MQMCQSLKSKSPWLEFYSIMPSLPPNLILLISVCVYVC